MELIEGNDKYRCEVCNIYVPNNQKSVKQHLKSLTHKKHGQGKGSNKRTRRAEKKQRRVSSGCSDDSGEEDLEILLKTKLGNGIPVSPRIHPEFADNIFRRDVTRPCILPRIVHSPTRRDTKPDQLIPFLTVDGGSIAEAPVDLERILELYLSNDGQKERVPNIDINCVRIEVASWKHARIALSEANANGQQFWATCVVPDLQHPKWYDPKRFVPTYDQVIVANAGSGIGLHIDTYKGRPVATYITIFHGMKHVLLLPPTGTEYSDFFGDDSSMTKTKPFPLDPSPELIERIREAKGYYFDIAPLPDGTPLTMYMPLGWHHWILSASPWTCLVSASMF